MHGMGLAKIYPYGKFKVYSLTRSKDRPTAHVLCDGWMPRVCAQTNPWISVIFIRPHQVWGQYSRMVIA